MLKIAVLGAGRMARGILEVIDENDRCQASGVWVRNAEKAGDFRNSLKQKDIPVSSDLAAVLADADIAIDFTLAEANAAVVENVLAANLPLVCGVSGLDDAQTKALLATSARIPLLYDRNMSYGIALMKRLLRDAGASLSDGFEAEIHESHHRHKKDAPSGTALLLGETLAAARGREFSDVYHYDPDGGATPEGSIRFVVTREGEIPGDHKIIFRGESETLEFSHSVADRRVFAEGAVRAALWLAGKPAGLYQMSDVLND